MIIFLDLLDVEPVRLIMHVRRFFCKQSTCAQKIFVERLPDLCRPHAQRTTRLQEALCRLGLRVGGQASADSASGVGSCLAAYVSVQLARTLTQLRRAEEQRPAQTQAIQQAQQARRAERTARYEHILALQRQGMKSGEMARTLGMSQRTLQRWIATGTIPYARRKRPRARLIDPYKAYLLKR
jgi:DNA-binding transcriptional regulator YiaG